MFPKIRPFKKIFVSEKKNQCPYCDLILINVVEGTVVTTLSNDNKGQFLENGRLVQQIKDKLVFKNIFLNENLCLAVMIIKR